MRVSLMFYISWLAGLIFAYPAFHADTFSLHYVALKIRDPDNDSIGSILPRDPKGKAPARTTSSSDQRVPSTEHAAGPSNRDNSAYSAQRTSPHGRLRADRVTHPRNGETSVNSSPVRECSLANKAHNARESEKRSGAVLSDQRPIHRQRADLTQREGNLVPLTGIVQHNTALAGPDSRTAIVDGDHAAQPGLAQRLQYPFGHQEAIQQESTRQHISPDVRARLQVARQLLQNEANILRRLPGPPQVFQFPGGRLPYVGGVPNDRMDPWQPIRNQHDPMFGTALRVALGEVRRPLAAAQMGQVVGGEQVAREMLGTHRIGRLQVPSHGAFGAMPMAHQEQDPAQDQDFRPNSPASSSAGSTHNPFEPST